MTVYCFLGGMSICTKGAEKGAGLTWHALVPERSGVQVMMQGGAGAGGRQGLTLFLEAHKHTAPYHLLKKARD